MSRLLRRSKANPSCPAFFEFEVEPPHGDYWYTTPHTPPPRRPHLTEMPQIQYSEKYYDDIYEYRYTLHPAFTRREPRGKK